MKKTNLLPIFLLSVMALSIAGAFIFKHWLFMFVATEMILFHLVPPFAVLLSMLAYKKKLWFWFNQFSWEKSLYKKLNVKHWKKHIPSYDTSAFSIKLDSNEDVIKLMIQSENVHLILFFASFVPLLLGKHFSNWPAMIVLSILFALSHLPFVIVQRYNLPRILQITFV